MPLVEEMARELTAAMKAKDAVKLSALRMAKAAFDNYKIAKQKERLEDVDVVIVLQKEAKQREESLASFEKAGRHDLAEKERRELAVLRAYLPTPLTESELTAVAEKAIRETGAKTKADLGKVMKALMSAVQGKADGKLVNQVVSRLLS